MTSHEKSITIHKRPPPCRPKPATTCRWRCHFLTARQENEPCLTDMSWWRHQMETFSALVAICAGNSPVNGEFPVQRQATRRFNVFFDLHLNERLSKQSWGWWFETLLRPLWRHSNGIPRVIQRTPGTAQEVGPARSYRCDSSRSRSTCHRPRRGCQLTRCDHGGSRPPATLYKNMKTSRHGNVFRITGHLWGESTHQPKDSIVELGYFLIC